MTPQMSETIAESCDTETFEFRFGPGFGMKVNSHTVETPEPSFEDIKDLLSDIPLRFKRYPSFFHAFIVFYPGAGKVSIGKYQLFTPKAPDTGCLKTHLFNHA